MAIVTESVPVLQTFTPIEIEESFTRDTSLFHQQKDFPLTGLKAFEAFNETIIMKALDPLNNHLWLINNGPTFSRGSVAPNPWGYQTRLKKKDKPESRETVGKGFELYPQTRERSEKEGNGVTWIPTGPQWFPIKAKFTGSKILYLEFDGISIEQQWEFIELLRAKGLNPSAIVGSGGKSLHVYFLLDTKIDEQTLLYLNGLFIPFGCDPRPASNVVNQMRVPGFYRYSKGKEQTLEYLSESVYSVSGIIEAAKLVYAEKGIHFETLEERAEKEKAERARYENYEAADLGKFEGDDLRKLVNEILSELPPREPGKGTYNEYRKIATAIARFIGLENAINLMSVHSPQENWGKLRTSKGKFGFKAIIESMRILVNPNWQLPQWFQDKYPFNSSKNQDNFDLEKWKAEKKTEYKRLKTYTPTQIVNYRYISDMPTPKTKGKIIFFGASLGTGKTQLMLKILRENPLLGAILPGARNGLLQNTVGESGEQIIHINLNKSEFNDQDNTAWFTACWDSILKINKEWFVGKLLVMDEVVAQFHHLFFSKTLEGKRFEIIERFLYIVEVSSGIVCFDGHLFDGIPNLFRKICPSKTVECIDNAYQVKRPKINYLEGIIENQKIKKNDRSPWLKHAKDTIRNSPISMASDSRIFLKSVAEILNGLGKKGLLITSETINKPEVKAFLKNPDKWILENKPDYLLYSPSAESGLNVPIKGYFKAFYAFYFGVLGVDAQRQMLMRIRDIECPRWVWLRAFSIVTENSFKYNYTSQEVMSRLIEESNLLDVDNLGDVLEGLRVKIESFAQPIIELVQEFKAIAEHERIAFREAFLEAINEDGYEVEHFTPESDEEAKQEIKNKPKEVKKKESLEIFSASDKFIGKGEIMLSENATDDDRRAFEKAKIVNLLPAINDNPIWSPAFIHFVKFERYGVIHQRRRYLMATNLDLARRLGNRRYASYVHKAGFCPWEMKFDYAQAKAIADSKVLELLKHNGRFTAKDPIIQEIVNACKKSKIHKALGRSTGKDPIKFVRWLIGLLGYKLSHKDVKGSDGNGHREYFLDLKDIAKTEAYFKVIDKILLSKMELNVLVFEKTKIYVEEVKNESFNFGYSDPPQTITVHGVESVVDQGNIFIKNMGDLQPSQMKVEGVQIVQKNEIQEELKNEVSEVKLNVVNVELREGDDNPIKQEVSNTSWHNYMEGQKVWLWRYFEGQEIWLPATIRSIVPSLLHVVADGGFYGRYIEAHTLNLIAPMYQAVIAS